jgi:predicted peptidase
MKCPTLPRLFLLLPLLVGSALAEMREWKTSDGEKSITAEYVKSGEGSVTIRRKADSRNFTIALDTLSEQDREWVAQKEEEIQEEALRQSKDNPFMALITGEWERHEGHDLGYRIYGGKKLRRGGEERYPLLVYLHGRNGDVMTPDQPGDARRFTEEENYKKRPCFVIAPQCPTPGSWDGANAQGVVKIIGDLVKHLPIDKDRIYLTGFSMGGYGTFHLLAAEPKLFAAGVPVAGGGNPQSAGEFKKVPVWVFHGENDDAVNVSQSRDLVAALEKARGVVKYTEYPGEGHGIIGKVYSDSELHEWLFAQSRN